MNTNVEEIEVLKKDISRLLENFVNDRGDELTRRCFSLDEKIRQLFQSLNEKDPKVFSSTIEKESSTIETVSNSAKNQEKLGVNFKSTAYSLYKLKNVRHLEERD